MSDRIVDGWVAANFMQALEAYIENPIRLFSASASVLPDLAPAFLAQFDPVFFGRRLDSRPCGVAVVVADILHLVEPRDGVAHMGSVFERLLALLGEGERAGFKIVTVFGGKFGHRKPPAD